MEALKNKVIANIQGMFKTPNYPWNILIIDDYGRKVLAPIFTVGQLKHMCVSLTIGLHEKRCPVPQTAAVYFVHPDSLPFVIADIKKGMYAAYFIDLITCASDEVIAYLSRELRDVEANVCRVYDRYSSFIVEGPNVFSLGIPNAMFPLYFGAADKLIISQVDAIANGVMSVCISLGEIPTIRYPSHLGSTASTIAIEINARFEKYVALYRNKMQASPTTLTPLNINSPSAATLIIMDRFTDMVPLLGHFWTYDALINDLLGKQDCFVQVGDAKYDLADSSDSFFNKHRHELYHEVSADCHTQNQILSNKLSTIKNSEKNGLLLQSAFNEAPILLKEKSDIGKHTAICENLLRLIEARNIDSYNRLLQENCGPNNFGQQLKEKVVESLRNVANQGTPIDYQRLCLCFELSYGPQISDVIDMLLTEAQGKVSNAVIKIRLAIAQFSKYKSFNTDSPNTVPQEEPNLLNNMVGKGRTLFRSMKGSTFSCKLVDTASRLMNNDEEDYSKLSPIGPKEPNSRVIIFIVGGGSSYESFEFEKLALKEGWMLCYGSTNFDRAEEIIQKAEAV